MVACQGSTAKASTTSRSWDATSGWTNWRQNSEREREDNRCQSLMPLKDPNLLSILGGKTVMIESLLIREIVAERRHKDILKVLAIRFGPVPPELAAEVRSILDETVLDAVVELAASSPDLEQFGAGVRAIPRPPEPWDPA